MKTAIFNTATWEKGKTTHDTVTGGVLEEFSSSADYLPAQNPPLCAPTEFLIYLCLVGWNTCICVAETFGGTRNNNLVMTLQQGGISQAADTSGYDTAAKPSWLFGVGNIIPSLCESSLVVPSLTGKCEGLTHHSQLS